MSINLCLLIGLLNIWQSQRRSFDASLTDAAHQLLHEWNHARHD